MPTASSPAVLAALDVGGTKLAATVATADGPLLRLTEPTRTAGPPDTIAVQALALIDAVCAQAGLPAAAITTLGVSSCGPFVRDAAGALALVPPNLCGGLAQADDLPNDWTSIPLEQTLRRRFAQVEIRNDCVAALVGERCFGAAQDEPNCAYVTWSTGIGFGLCVDGQILHGKHGNAGHAGHMLLSEVSEALCGCGNRGDLEGLAAGRNLGNRLGRPLAEVFAAAEAGDAAALAALEEAARWFGRGLYNLVTTLDLNCILVGGSVWRHHAGLLAPRVQAEISTRFAALTAGVRVESAALGDLVTDIGALALVMPPAWIADWRVRQPWLSLRSVTSNPSPAPQAAPGR